VLASCTQQTAGDDGRLCTPGNYVYCTCEDRSHGTKLCHADGQTFDACKCTSTSTKTTDVTGAVTEVFKDAGVTEVDSGPVDDTAPKIDDSCTNKLAVVAGLNTDSDIYGAAYNGAGAFKVVKSTGPGLRSAALIVPVTSAPAAPLLAVWTTKYTLLASMTYTAGSWSAPESIGIDNPAQSDFGPSLTRLRSNVADLGYRGTDGVDYDRIYDPTNGWSETTPGIDAGAPNAKTPSLASFGSDVYAATLTQDNAVVVMKGPTWGAPTTIATNVYPTAPVLVGLDGSESKDLLVVWVGNSQTIQYSVRTTVGKSWSKPASISPTAQPLDDIAIAAIAPGRAIVAWRGVNKHGFTARFDSDQGTWSAPAEIDTSNDIEELSTPVAIATARCGGDVATAAYALAGSGIEITRFNAAGGTQTFVVPGIPKADWVGVGESQ
jgi:hypothetical protein